MDGTMAVMWLVFSLAEMTGGGCAPGCLASQPVASRSAVSSGGVFFDGNEIGSETYVRRDLGRSFGPLQPVVGASTSTLGDLWVGAGTVNEFTLWGTGLYVQLHFMPGLYLRGDGPVLGHRLEFRSGVEVGYEAASGIRYAVTFDHRSNGDIVEVNPGLESLQFKISHPTDRATLAEFAR